MARCIGIDMMGIQESDTRGRGIGRYTEQLVAALLKHHPENKYVLYFFDTVDDRDRARFAGADVRVVPTRPGEIRGAVQRVVDDNADQLDCYLVTHPFAYSFDYLPPAKTDTAPFLAAVLYDLIPIVFDRAHYLGTNCDLLTNYYERIRRLSRYDRLLAISEATRRDALVHLGIPGRRVTAISSATREDFFEPPKESELPPGLRALAVRKPYVLTVSHFHASKNLDGLIHGFALLPAAVREAHQLVVVCSLNEDEQQRARTTAERQGIPGRLVLTGAVPDELLRAAYQHCAAFVCASHYEGFGLPILEAMRCGAPVLAGNNSAQVEVAHGAGLLVRTNDPLDIAGKLEQVLTDPGLAARLSRQGLDRAQEFTWVGTAGRVVASLEQARVAQRPKPLVAFFSPFPPQRSGVADYAEALLDELAGRFAIHLYHDAGQVPHLALRRPDLAAFDYRAFARQARVWNYDAVLYQMGNSSFHDFVYETLLRFPGVVTLHDPRLIEFHAVYAQRSGNPLAYLEQEAAFCHPELAPREHARIAREVVREWQRQPAPGISDLFLNRRVFARATRVLVHDAGIAERLRAAHPGYRERIQTIPLGTALPDLSASERTALRAEFGWPADAFIIGSFGSLHPIKLNQETVEAFQRLAGQVPGAQLVFAGTEFDRGATRQTVAARGLERQVRFLGYQPPEIFRRFMKAVDVAVNLRRPPTQGESSASFLQLLGAGVPTVVTDCGSFSSFPDEVVCKVRADERLVERLAGLLATLASDRGKRLAMEAQAQKYVARHHSWPLVAEQYRIVIENEARKAKGCRPCA